MPADHARSRARDHDAPRDPSRRSFLAGAAGLAGALTATGLASRAGALTGPASSVTSAPGAQEHDPTGDRHFLFLEGKAVGWLDALEGGTAVGEVIVEEGSQASGVIRPRKRLRNVTYEEITILAGRDVVAASPFADWVTASAGGTAPAISGEIVTVDSKGENARRMAFFNALVTELGLPALDAASKDAARLTVRFAPEYTRITMGGGAPPLERSPAPWTVANFTLEIGGLETGQVAKIDAFTIKQRMIEEGARIQQASDITITLTESSSSTWTKWHEDFVVNGNNGDDQERSGSLSYLTPADDEILTVEFRHLGIFRLAPAESESNSDRVRRVTAELYCEDMDISLPKPP
jgi:hypothetical protein